MTRDAKLNRLLNRLYAVSEGPEAWEPFLDSFGDAVHSGVTSLMAQDFRANENSVLAAVRVDPATLEHYQLHYAGLNPWMQASVRHLHVPGMAVYGEQIVAHEDFCRTRFYHEFGKPNDVVYALGLTISVVGEVHGFLTTNRGELGGSYTEEEHSILAELAPHLRRVLAWQSRMQSRPFLEQVFEHQPDAIWEVDGRGRVGMANRAARAALDRAAMVRVRERVLEVRMREGWRSVAALAAGQDPYRIVISQDGSVPEGLLTVASMDLPAPAQAGRRYLVTFTSLQAPALDVLEAAARLLGLTAGEARLASALVHHRGLARAAAALGVSVNTAKTQLASAMQKVGVNSQTELLMLVRRCARA